MRFVIFMHCCCSHDEMHIELFLIKHSLSIVSRLTMSILQSEKYEIGSRRVGWKAAMVVFVIHYVAGQG